MSKSDTELLDWLEDECLDLICVSSPIADTGDYDVRWEVHEHLNEGRTKATGFGETPRSAIFDATLDANDPRRSDYVPPEFRN